MMIIQLQFFKKILLILILITTITKQTKGQAVMLRDINVGVYDSYPTGFTSLGSELFFSANNNNSGITNVTLWKTDGTNTTGVTYQNHPLAIRPRAPLDLIVFGSELFFTAYEGTHGRELWKTDGTNANTTLVMDINSTVISGTYAGSAFPYTIFGGFEVLGSELFFTADDGVNGYELWKTDGTNTSLVMDINNSGGSKPSYLTVLGSELFFTADDGTNGIELWKTDGTTATMVMDINSNGSSNPARLTVFNSELFFIADDGVSGYELWKTDGTNTSLVMDINNNGGSLPNYFTVLGSELFFSADDGLNGQELWKTDGTAANTNLVMDINPFGNSFPNSLTIWGSQLFFTASNGINGQEIWKTDGTATNTTQVHNLNYNGVSGPSNLTVLGSELFFSADDGIHGRELWKTNGTTASLVTDIRSNGSSTPSNFKTFGSKLFFVADNGINGRELWMVSNAVGINQNYLSPYSIYPNPTKGSINIDLKETKMNINLRLTNALGQVVLTKNYKSTNHINFDLDAPKGIYFLQIETSNGEIITSKIIKQ